MKKRTRCATHVCILVATLLVFAGGVLAFIAFTKPAYPPVYYADTNVQCLPRGHEGLELSYRMPLTITVDGQSEVMPLNIGNMLSCTTELHTHAADGTVYAEFYDKERAAMLTFADFFAVWNASLEREGYAYAIHEKGMRVDSLADITLEDKKSVTITYTALATSTKAQ